tara:strand:- start:2526 stop:3275 length:750 start_codon:yes stop_codon:yes gene_type:complete
MKVIIIAAGTSTRLGNLTEEIPKGLLKINNKSILEIQIQQFKKKNISKIIIITGPHHEKFHFDDVSLINDRKYMEHDVLGSLMIAKSEMNSEIITSYSDIIFENSVLDSLLQFKGDIGIAVDLNWEEKYLNRTEHPKNQADNVVIEDNKVVKIKKNISKYESTQQIGEFLGLMKLSDYGAEIFIKKYDELIQSHQGKFQDAQSIKKAYLTDLIQELIDSGMKISPIFINGRWTEIDTPQDLESARKIWY